MDAWITSHFVNATFVAGGAAMVVSPIIIHLINRMRYRRVRFAAMEFLLQSKKRNQNRVLIQQLLLLLLRILIVLAIVALLSRFIWDSRQLAALTQVKTHHVVVLDDSGSMRDKVGQETAFEEGVKVVNRIVQEAAKQPGSQLLTLYLLSDTEQPFFTQREITDDFMKDVLEKMKSISCSHQTLDPAQGLEAVREYLKDDQTNINHVYFISDFRSQDWLEQKGMAKAVKALDESDVTVNLVKVVDEQHRNLAVTELSGEFHLAISGFETELNIKVKNFGETVEEDVRLSIFKDGEKLPLSVVIDKIEPGAEVSKTQYVTFAKPGKHRVEVALDVDSLDSDNHRFVAVDVFDSARVLVVQGDTSSDAARLVADALGDPHVNGVTPEIVTPAFLRTNPLQDYRCIYMINVPGLRQDEVDAVEEFVGNGGGLAWYLGSGINPVFYRDQLYARGLFPVPLDEKSLRELNPQETEEGQAGDIRLKEDYETFEKMFVDGETFTSVVRVFRFWTPTEDWERNDNVRNDGVQTVAHVRTKHPLMFDHQFGQGRVFTSLTSAGGEWNNIFLGPAVVIRIATMGRISNKSRALANMTVGETLSVVRKSIDYRENIDFTGPDGRPVSLKADRRKASELKAGNEKADEGDASEIVGDGAEMEGESLPAADEILLVANYGETDLPGIYRYMVYPSGGGLSGEENWVAFNVPVQEGDLKLASTDDLLKQIGDDVEVNIHEPGELEWIEAEAPGQEMKMWLLILIILLFLGEQMLAYRLSFHPKTA